MLVFRKVTWSSAGNIVGIKSLPLRSNLSQLVAVPWLCLLQKCSPPPPVNVLKNHLNPFCTLLFAVKSAINEARLASQSNAKQ